MNLRYLLLCLLLASRLDARVELLRQSPPLGLTSADLYIDSDLPATKGVLVLCPGMNGDGAELISEVKWRDFARREGLALVGLSFSSSPDLLYGTPGQGYYYPEQGAGHILIEGIKKLYGKNAKIVIFGFSGGAEFASRFVSIYQDRVISWGVYGAMLWPKSDVINISSPPGLIACGEYDSTRYGPSFAYFQKIQSQGARCTWVSLGGADHVRNNEMEDFARIYFSTIIKGGDFDATWVDAETKLTMSEDQRAMMPSFSVWLPSPALFRHWQALHHP